MEIFIARQPILTSDRRVFAYELLSRSGPANLFPGGDPDQASSKMILDGLGPFDFSTLTGERPAFINLPQQLLLEGHIRLIPPEKVVVEILEDVTPDELVLTAVRALKQEGYRIALDDVVCARRPGQLVELADIIKVDILEAGMGGARNLIQELGRPGLVFLAEKVETWADYEEARRIGFKYFQGYYFQRPEMISGGDVPRNRQVAMLLADEINRAPMDFHRIEELIKQDMSLTYRILRMVNSAWAGLPREIVSIGHAIVMLGEEQVRHLIEASTLACLGDDSAEELVLRAFIRAHFLESLAPLMDLQSKDQELYFLGLFSWLDAMLGVSMETVLESIPLGDDASRALLDRGGELGTMLQLCDDMEMGDWLGFEERCLHLGLASDHAARLHSEAIKCTLSSPLLRREPESEPKPTRPRRPVPV